MILLNPTLIVPVRLGEDRDEHGEGSVVVEQPQEEPDPPEDDESVMVEDDNTNCDEDIDDEDDLAGCQTPGQVLHVVQDLIREAKGVGHMVMGQGEADGGGQEPRQQEHTR